MVRDLPPLSMHCGGVSHNGEPVVRVSGSIFIEGQTKQTVMDRCILLKEGSPSLFHVLQNNYGTRASNLQFGSFSLMLHLVYRSR
jgi:hypothetical protein